MPLGIDPKVDFAFKWLFGREPSKLFLIDLLHATLDLPMGEEIVDIEILNPFTAKIALDDKLSILDIKARDARGRYFNVEMQMVGFPALFQRILYYWGKVYTEQLSAGEDYSLLKPTISICFVDSIMLPGVRDYHTSYQITEKEHGIVLTEDLQIHILELPKFTKAAGELTTGLDRWLYFMQHAPELDRSELPETMDTVAIRQAMEGLMILEQTDMEREIYEGRIKARRDERARQHHYESIQAAYDAAQADREAMQAANEAMQTANEAMQAANEAMQAAKDEAEAVRDAMQAERDAQSTRAEAQTARAEAEAARAEAEAARATLAMEQLSRLTEQLAQAEQKGELLERISTLQRRLGQEPTPHDELRMMRAEELQRLGDTLAQQVPHS